MSALSTITATEEWGQTTDGWGSSSYWEAYTIFTELERRRLANGGDPKLVMRGLVQVTFTEFNRDPSRLPRDVLEPLVSKFTEVDIAADPVKLRYLNLFNGTEGYSSFEEAFDVYRKCASDLWTASDEIFKSAFIGGKFIYHDPVDAVAIDDDPHHPVNLAMRCWLLWVLGLFTETDNIEVFGNFDTLSLK